MNESPVPAPQARTRSLLERIFLSPDEPRLRAGWRLLIQTILFLLFQICLAFPLIFLTPYAGNAMSDTPIAILSLVVGFFAIVGSVLPARRLLDRRSIGSLGFALNMHTLYDILAGIAITFVLMGAIFVSMWALGWLDFQGFAWQVDPAGNSLVMVVLNLLLWFVAFIIVGFQEELLARGYYLQNMADGLNLTWGVILSSVIFGLLHITNPSSSLIAVAGIFFAGLFLAYAYVRTRQLWLSIGLHIGWNFFEGVVFGFQVSGLDTYRMVQTSVHGPELWTGGLFGPEAGLIVLPALALGAVLIYLYTHPRFRGSLTATTSQ